MHSKVVQVTTTPMKLLRGPHWDVRTQRLNFADSHGKTIHQYDPKIKEHTWASVAENKVITIFIPVENEEHKFLISNGNRLATAKWDGESRAATNFEEFQSLDEKIKSTRNEGKVSPSGVFFVGTRNHIDFRNVKEDEKEPLIGRLYAIKDGESKIILSDVALTNGMTWSLDEREFYYADSIHSKIYGFDYDKMRIELSNKKVILDLEENNIRAVPNGMTIDTDGNLWVACFGAGKVAKVNPKLGMLLELIDIPALATTSVTFGGTKLDELYVTTGYLYASKEELKLYPKSGCLFKITGTGSQGLPAPTIRLRNLGKYN